MAFEPAAEVSSIHHRIRALGSPKEAFQDRPSSTSFHAEDTPRKAIQACKQDLTVKRIKEPEKVRRRECS